MVDITGPLGLWRFPLLNRIVGLLRGGSRRRSKGEMHRKMAPGMTLAAENEEQWELVRDRHGRITEIIVHRRVERTQ